MTVPVMYNFRNLLNKFPIRFLTFNFSHFTPQARPTSFPGGENPENEVEARLFFVGKGKTKILGIQNCDGERNHFRYALKSHLKFSGK